MDNLETLVRKVDHVYSELFFTALSLEKITHLLEEQNRLMRTYLKAQGIATADKEEIKGQHTPKTMQELLPLE